MWSIKHIPEEISCISNDIGWIHTNHIRGFIACAFCFRSDKLKVILTSEWVRVWLCVEVLVGHRAAEWPEHRAWTCHCLLGVGLSLAKHFTSLPQKLSKGGSFGSVNRHNKMHRGKRISPVASPLSYLMFHIQHSLQYHNTINCYCYLI